MNRRYLKPQRDSCVLISFFRINIVSLCLKQLYIRSNVENYAAEGVQELYTAIQCETALRLDKYVFCLDPDIESRQQTNEKLG